MAVAQPIARRLTGLLPPASSRLLEAVCKSDQSPGKQGGETDFEIVANPGCIRKWKAIHPLRGVRPHPACPPLARGGKGWIARAVILSRATKTCLSKPSLNRAKPRLFITPGSGPRSLGCGCAALGSVTLCVLVPATILARSASEGSGYTRLRFGLVCRGRYTQLNRAPESPSSGALKGRTNPGFVSPVA